MRLEAELQESVQWFLRHECSQRELATFYERLEAVRTEPIRNSEGPASLPKKSKYTLRFFRFFRFSGNLAVFEFDAAKKRIRVVECRKSLPRKRRATQSPGDAEPL